MLSVRLSESRIDGNSVQRYRTIKVWGNGVDFPEDALKENESSIGSLVKILKVTFLPVGYPHAVRPEYLKYQFWDSIQGMSSYLRSVLTTRAVLAGAGVGSSESTALAAALTWVFRDGVGMIGSLAFAYCYADTFEVYIKEWRYLADILNNVGLTLDLISSAFPRWYFMLTSISTLCKACCGLIAGATKARISAHFAMPGHLADVTAKESTQETAVALVGLLLGMVLAQWIGNDDRTIWITFTVLLLVHQYSNYHLVKVLVFSNMNPQRCYLLASNYITGQEVNNMATSPVATKRKSSPTAKRLPVPSPADIASLETFMRPIYLTFFGPQVGSSAVPIVKAIQFIVVNRSGTFTNHAGMDVSVNSSRLLNSSEEWVGGGKDSILSSNVAVFFAQLLKAFENEQFLVGLDMNCRVVVCLKEGISKEAIVKAYLVSYYIFIRLEAKLALFVANFYSKHRYLTLRYEFLIGTLANEALNWYYQSFNRQPSSLSDNGNFTAERSENWNCSEISALSCSEWRLADIGSKQK